MKTFKLISLQILAKEKLIPIKLIDGLIINKEDDYNHWLIEVYTDFSSIDFLDEAFNKKDDLLVQAVITKKENDPAPFEVTILSIQKFGDKASIMLEGTLKRDRKDYAELLLQYLIEEGYEGNKLTTKFTELMQSKPQTFLEKKL
ncbi:YwpF family protein [Niallia sp. FSL W8-0635]|uniref:YwpF family protein n=1 Tax=Niallia sp. FSL W8-0635 TaxID=2975337 RepID=UPI0030FCCAA2